MEKLQVIDFDKLIAKRVQSLTHVNSTVQLDGVFYVLMTHVHGQ